MEVEIEVGKNIHRIKADNYEIKLNADYKRYANGYIELSKIYPFNDAVRYERDLIKYEIKRPPYRFHFGKDRTHLFVSDVEEPNMLNFCTHIDWYHIVKMECKILKYSIPSVYQNDIFYMIYIENLYVEEN